NEGEFLAVPGVGEVKLERYGKRFLEIINEWRRR
ncbi:MAG: HRDC domain-containing protein, partial [Synergistaceae bacterium]|nr:HRDC domain-containing protein [Synergistaceae bacterium]